jgi:hypothetical protein
MRNMTRTVLFALGTTILTQTLAAQPMWQYTYTGNKYSTATGPYTTNMRFTLGFLTPFPIPKNIPINSFNIINLKPIATQVSVSDGIFGRTAFRAADVAVSLEIDATDADGIPLAWNWLFIPTLCPFDSQQIEDFGSAGGEHVSASDCRTFTQLGGAASFAKGIWTTHSPTPVTLTAYLLTLVTGMNIGDQGTSLTDQLIAVLTDINNNTLGLACSDLTAFTNHVSAQTGKKITIAQVAQIQTWAGYIRSGIPCQ